MTGLPAIPLVLREAALDALAILLPVDCAGCGAADRMLCDRCRDAVRPAVRQSELADGTPVWAGLEYAGRARRVLLALKEEGRTGVASTLALGLAAAIRAAVIPAAVLRAAGQPQGDAASARPIELCAVPATRAARRRRGYDPVRLVLARCGLRDARVFAAARPHRGQKSLGVEDRAANVAGVFRVRAAVRGRRFLLVDDVVTTGATLFEVARVLRAAGADVVGAATVAATPKHNGRPKSGRGGGISRVS